MSNTVRSEAQLDALFLDNNVGDISAQDGRDFIATFFAYKGTTDPTNNNDSADSVGIGAYFSEGSRWLNTATQIEWVCYSGIPHLAIWQPNGSSSVTVSISLVMPGIFAVSGSPAGATGTFTVTLATETANTVFAGPTTGIPASPTFRALVPADIPGLPASQIVSGVFSLAQLPAGYPAADLGSGTIPGGVSVPFGNVTAGYPAADLGSGTIAAGVTVPYSQVTGGPSAPSAATITATGTTQGTAAALTADNNLVTVGSVGNNGVILPANTGARIIVANRTGSVTIAVFPPVGESMQGLPVNSYVALNPGVESLFMRFTNALGYFYWGRIG